MGLLRKALNRLRTLLNRTSVHPDQDNETPVGACAAADGGSGSGSEAIKEKNTRKRKRFWRWHSRRKKYSVAKAEKLNQTFVAGAGTYRSHSQGLKAATPTDDYKLEQEVLQPVVLNTSVWSSADDHTDTPVRLPADGSFDSAVNSTAHNAIACAVGPIADEGIASAGSQNFNSAVRPKAERDIACAISPKVDGDVACTVRPKVDRDTACAVRLKVNGGLASAELPKADKGIASAGRSKENKGIASKGRPKVDKGVASKGHSKLDQGIASKGRPKVDKGIASKGHPKEDKVIASAGHPKEDKGIASKGRPKENKGIASKGHPEVDVCIASAGCPKVDGGIGNAVRTQVDYVPTGDLDKDHICWQYKFGGRLGEGGFGSVRKGTRYKDGLKVAVKYVRKTKHTTYITTAFHPKPLPLEIALAVIVNRKPNCPHIIEMLDWQDDPDHYLIVMQRPVPSMDMGKFLKCSGGVLSEQIAQYIMWQVIYAANFCCYRGVFHRDIKLENVLVNPTTLEIKLIDFGCGDLMKDSGYTACCGTKPYFPPEYHDAGRYHAKPATVYSLGVLLFTMLHGRFPTARHLYYLGNNQSVFAVSQECIRLLWAGLQRHPEHRIPLEQMLYHDWFVLGFPNPLPFNRNASKQHSCHR